MTFNRKVGKSLQWLAILAGGLFLGHEALPDALPNVVPPEYLPLAIIGLQVAQKLIHDKAWERNWNGSPASSPAPPDPREVGR